MPLMPNGTFETIGYLRLHAKGLRDRLAVAENTDRLTHPAAIKWQRELVEIETVIQEYTGAD